MTKDTPGVIAPPPLLWLGAAVGSLLSQYLFSWRLGFSGIRVIGFALVLIGALIALLAVRSMQRAKTPVDPNQSPTALVTSGPYRISRNPIYLALLLWLMALAGIRETVWPIIWAVPLALIIHYGVILREERFLTAHFPEDYLPYQKSTRRWL